MNKLEDAMKNLNANSQATAGELRIIKSDLSKLEKTMDATKDKLATFKSDLDAVKRTADGDNQSYRGDFTNNLSTVKESYGDEFRNGFERRQRNNRGRI
ncbi:hypothetical protein OUZ56_020270 [Daphnia magna]|uniref:Uncharacterized protein n=1 Tax=Daphnia magna TaxID=35525 RepID=A0ABQ9ZF33_9CRUS|nr:hypothetical protein OUZ56_020270 [Daphnia magna]